MQAQSSRHPAMSLHRTRTHTVITRTLEAFADAVDRETRALDAWCAAREEAMCRAQAGVRVGAGAEVGGIRVGREDEDEGLDLVVSLLSTEKALKDAFENSFEVLLRIVRTVFIVSSRSSETQYRDAKAQKQEQKPHKSNFKHSNNQSNGTMPREDSPLLLFQTGKSRAPAATTAVLLDTLFASVQEHMERREGVTADALMRVFVGSAEPAWGMIGAWLRDGMWIGGGTGGADGTGVRGRVGPDGLDEEFFIERSELGMGMVGIGLLDPDFWAEGYALREGVDLDLGPESEGVDLGLGVRATPAFLEHVAGPVLGAGKALGLLRALGVPLSGGERNLELVLGPGEWHSFSKLLALDTKARTFGHGPEIGQEEHNSGSLFSISVDTLSGLIYDVLLPHCEATGALLANVLVEDCALWHHLSAVEDLFLMRRGDAMSHFTDVLFAKVCRLPLPPRRSSDEIDHSHFSLLLSPRWTPNNRGATSTS